MCVGAERRRVSAKRFGGWAWRTGGVEGRARDTGGVGTDKRLGYLCARGGSEDGAAVGVMLGDGQCCEAETIVNGAESE